MKTKESFKIIIQLLIILTISYISSFIYQNYDLIKESNTIGIKNLEKKIISTNFESDKNGHYISKGENSEIKFNIDKKYINKIKFNYKTDSNFKWKIILNEEDNYGNYKEKTIEGISSNKIEIFSEKINNKIVNITFITDNENLEIYDIRLVNEFDYFSSYTIIFMFIFISFYLIIKYKKYISSHVEYLFLIIALCSGMSMIMSMPIAIGTSWDDETHFIRTYGLVNEYYSEASYELNQVTQTSFSMFNTEEEADAYKLHLNKIDNKYTNIKTDIRLTYQSVGYLIPSLIYSFGNLLGINISTLFIMGKIVNLLTYTIIIFFAIKKIPKGKYLMLVISLLPTAIFLASNYSYDYFVTAFIMLGLAYFYYEFYSKEKKLNSKNIIISIVSIVLASFPKAIYIPLILLLLLLPAKKFNNNKQCIKFKLSVIIIFILIMSTFILPTVTGTMAADSRGGNTSVSEQLKLIIRQPVSFAKIFKDNVLISGVDKLFGEIGLTMYGYYGIIQDKNVYYAIILLLIFSININNEKTKNNLNIKEKLYIISIIIITICFIWGSMYLIFTPIASTIINGVQNRYFIPLIFPLLLLLNFEQSDYNLKPMSVYYIYSIILTGISFYSILIKFV